MQDKVKTQSTASAFLRGEMPASRYHEDGSIYSEDYGISYAEYIAVRQIMEHIHNSGAQRVK